MANCTKPEPSCPCVPQPHCVPQSGDRRAGVLYGEYVSVQRGNWGRGQRWYSRSKVRGAVKKGDVHEEGRRRKESRDEKMRRTREWRNSRMYCKWQEFGNQRDSVPLIGHETLRPQQGISPVKWE